MGCLHPICFLISTINGMGAMVILSEKGRLVLACILLEIVIIYCNLKYLLYAYYSNLLTQKMEKFSSLNNKIYFRGN